MESSPQPATNGREATPPDPEVPAKARRRQYPASYRLQIVQAADACQQPGEVAALLRREGLYSSHLATWRAQRERGELGGGSKPSRGRPATPRTALQRENQALRRQVARLARKLEQANTVIDVQKKLSSLLDSTPETLPPTEPA